MDEMNLATLLDAQRQFFVSGATRSYQFRIEQLKKVKALLQNHEDEIGYALYQDLHKPKAEAILTEILMVIKEIDFIIKHLKKWMQARTLPTPFLLWPARSSLLSEPYGLVLILSPWNYPIQLSFSPLIGAICAGNCVVIKPSEISYHTESLLGRLIPQYFSKTFITVVKGGHEMTQTLLKEHWDYIFYTGGMHTGKIVMNAAAKHLTPLTLELGGKSPCIVDESADLDFAARRIAWAKTTNAGQVCIAPDYLLVHASRKHALIKKLQQCLIQFYGNDPAQSKSYGRIINAKHVERLSKLLAHGNIIFGGDVEVKQKYISPTLIDGISWQDPIMQEEIFGPLLPIITFEHLDEVITNINALPKPLALYFFSHHHKNTERVLQEISFGGACINDCLLQIANLHLPFGGIGASGMGQYHGKYSYDTFSHHKSLYQKSGLLDFKLEYPPYTPRKLSWLRRLFKL